MTIFDHNGTVRELPSVNGTSNPIPPYFDVPRTLAASEGFRLRGDKLYRIEMTLIEVPYGMRTAFDSGERIDLSAPGSNNKTLPEPCNRACLNIALDEVLQAILKNDTANLPLAKGARYSENGQFRAFGDGLWETVGYLSKPGDAQYAAGFADAETGTAAYWGLTKEQSTPGVLALRIKVDTGKITEIEAVSVRAEASGERGGTLTLMRPPLPIEWEGDALGQLNPTFNKQVSNGTTPIPQSLVTAYLLGMERHSSAGIPFSPSCKRRDNGVQQNATCSAQMDGKGPAPNGLFNATIIVHDRRFMIADPDKGVVLVVANIDYSAASAEPLSQTQLVPSTYMIPQLIKIDNGTISQVEGFVKWMPFGYTSAWAEQKPPVKAS